MRRTSLAAGALYLLTFVSIPTLALYEPFKDHADFVLGAGSTTGVMWGAASEVVVALAGIGTAVVLFPVLKRQSQTAALAVVTTRLMETVLIIAGVVSLLALITLRSDVAGTAGADRASLVTAGHLQVAVYNWTFLLSQSLAPVIVDALLAYLLYRSRLVPRILPIVAMIGAPVLLASDVAVFAGALPQLSAVTALAAFPVAAFEFSLGVWLLVKGFNPSSPVFARPEADGAARIPSPRTGGREHEAQGVAIR
jgi:hypothetical protein